LDLQAITARVEKLERERRWLHRGLAALVVLILLVAWSTGAQGPKEARPMPSVKTSLLAIVDNYGEGTGSWSGLPEHGISLHSSESDGTRNGVGISAYAGGSALVMRRGGRERLALKVERGVGPSLRLTDKSGDEVAEFRAYGDGPAPRWADLWVQASTGERVSLLGVSRRLDSIEQKLKDLASR
jgi:hypothetical protein